MRTAQTPQGPVVRGEYSRDGYQVWVAGRVVYSAGNHALDSQEYATRKRDRLPLTTLRKFCIKTTGEIAHERNGSFGGVERATEEL